MDPCGEQSFTYEPEHFLSNLLYSIATSDDSKESESTVKKVTNIFLDASNLTDKFFQLFNKDETIAQIRLHSCANITDEGLCSLTRAKLPNLTMLTLLGCNSGINDGKKVTFKITEKSIQHLKKEFADTSIHISYPT